MIPPDSLISFLQACINLKVLHLLDIGECENRFDLPFAAPYAPDQYYSVRGLSRALAYCEHTVEELVLHIYRPVEQKEHRTYLDLSKSTKLQKLVIMGDLLPTCPSDRLPSNLEILRMMDADLHKDTLDQLPFWQNVKVAANCPVLREVTIYSLVEETTFDELLDLAEAFTIKGHCEKAYWDVRPHVVSSNLHPAIIRFTVNDVLFTVEYPRYGREDWLWN